jgi:DNA-binding winged helix-turn-helix (wHTH) protein
LPGEAIVTRHEYVIGSYRLLDDGDLSAEGRPVPLGSKASEILVTLVEAGGALVSKDDLMDRVWPGLVVEEHNIAVHISALRKALGAEAGWIVTVPRRGYRFVGPIEKPPLASPVTALPLPLTKLFGREEQGSAIRTLLSLARLVTIVGPGGIGKTRIGLELAHELAGRFRDGLVFIDLSVIQDSSSVLGAIGAALGVEFRQDQPEIAHIVNNVRKREVLIVLDNCEHVLDCKIARNNDPLRGGFRVQS